jgi:hypothetical protein
MKKIILNTLLLGTMVIAAGSCSKKADYTADRTYVTPADALLKINYLSAYALNPSVQINVNGQRVSGLITGRTPFPGGGYNTNGSNFPDYLALTPGSTTVSISIPKKNTNVDSVVLFTKSITTAAGKNISLHITDTLANTKSVALEDNLSIPANYYCNYTFVNMIPNAPLVDLYYNTTLMATGIPYLGTSKVFTNQVQTVAGTWSIRETGTLPTSTALATYSSLNTTINQRVYTVFASGYKGATATNTKPYVSFLMNR